MQRPPFPGGALLGLVLFDVVDARNATPVAGHVVEAGLNDMGGDAEFRPSRWHRFCAGRARTQPATVVSAPRSARACFSIAASSCRFILLKLDTGDLPLVENTSEQSAMRGTLASRWRASGARCTLCGKWFLVQFPDNRRVAISSLSSSARISANSPRRQPVNSSNFSNTENCGIRESVATRTSEVRPPAARPP